jgi:hypothetical protein
LVAFLLRNIPPPGRGNYIPLPGSTLTLLGSGHQKVEKMPEAYRVKIWIISASVWLFKKKFITMHGNMNVKFLGEGL